MAECLVCHSEMTQADGCALAQFDNQQVARILYGQEKRFRPADLFRVMTRCPDCGVKPDHYHHPGCDVEECPSCACQLLACRCYEFGTDR